MLPRHERNAFRQIELLPLSGTRVLAILVTSEGEVHNRIINTERCFTLAQLEQAANYLNRMFTGQDIQDVRKRLLDDLQDTHAEHGRTHDAGGDPGPGGGGGAPSARTTASSPARPT